MFDSSVFLLNSVGKFRYGKSNILVLENASMHNIHIKLLEMMSQITFKALFKHL